MDEWAASIKAPAPVVLGGHNGPTPGTPLKCTAGSPNARLATMPGSHGSFMGEALSADPDSKVPVLFVGLVDEFLM